MALLMKSLKAVTGKCSGLDEGEQSPVLLEDLAECKATFGRGAATCCKCSATPTRTYVVFAAHRASNSPSPILKRDEPS